jgi:nitroimidazol reductase NimA-like FMN-containing flavoprotein (pyridoxamine 5'-phosphate oxidase superfamily)
VPRRDFDIDEFLAQPLTARLATARPAVRPVWYLWEERLFWILTGPWSQVPAEISNSAEVALVVDTCDLATGECLQVMARGTGDLLPFDQQRAQRKLERYLGSDLSSWDPRFQRYLSREPDALWLKVSPRSLTAQDLSFAPSLPRPHNE